MAAPVTPVSTSQGCCGTSKNRHKQKTFPQIYDCEPIWNLSDAPSTNPVLATEGTVAE